jgi:hypothetical protein
MNIACYCGFPFSCVDEAFISGDGDCDVALGEAAPVFLYERDNRCANDFWCLGSDVEMLAEEWSVGLIVVFDFDKVWIAVSIC